jgi:hypothetical protein
MFGGHDLLWVMIRQRTYGYLPAFGGHLASHEPQNTTIQPRRASGAEPWRASC